jgi:Mo-dependent nitrogenase C-terminus
MSTNLQMTAPAALQPANSIQSFPLKAAAAASANLKRPRSIECPESIKQLFQPIQVWLDQVEVTDPEAARLLYKIIPGQCPFEREVAVLGRTLFSIPPLCKLNPFYDQLVAVRFRAMCYLVDECGESLESLS